MWALPTRVMLVRQYFDNAMPVAVVAVLLCLAAACVRPRPSLSSLARPASAPVAIAVAWILIPTAVLLVYSALRATDLLGQIPDIHGARDGVAARSLRAPD